MGMRTHGSRTRNDGPYSPSGPQEVAWFRPAREDRSRSAENCTGKIVRQKDAYGFGKPPSQFYHPSITRGQMLDATCCQTSPAAKFADQRLTVSRVALHY